MSWHFLLLLLANNIKLFYTVNAFKLNSLIYWLTLIYVTDSSCTCFLFFLLFLIVKITFKPCLASWSGAWSGYCPIHSSHMMITQLEYSYMILPRHKKLIQTKLNSRTSLILFYFTCFRTTFFLDLKERESMLNC